jgi:integrase
MQGGTRVFRRLPPGVTKGQAQELETKLRRELFEAGPLGKRPDLTLPAAIGLWLEHNRRKNQRKAESEARQWEEWVKGKLLKDAPEVAQAAVKAWTGRKNGMASVAKNLDAHGRTAAVATVNRRLCVLKAAAKLAWKMGLIQENVSGRISLLPERNQREVYLTTKQVAHIAICARSESVKAAIFIAAYTGLRASELLALPALDGRRNTLAVSVAMSKTSKPRVVPVASAVRPYLSALPLGLSYWQLHKEFDRAKAKAGLPHIRFHDLRHTCASWLINEGVDLYTVGKILGHSGPQTTARYAHLADKTLKKAMARLR